MLFTVSSLAAGATLYILYNLNKKKWTIALKKVKAELSKSCSSVSEKPIYLEKGKNYRYYQVREIKDDISIQNAKSKDKKYPKIILTKGLKTKSSSNLKKTPTKVEKKYMRVNSEKFKGIRKGSDLSNNVSFPFGKTIKPFFNLILELNSEVSGVKSSTNILNNKEEVATPNIDSFMNINSEKSNNHLLTTLEKLKEKESALFSVNSFNLKIKEETKDQNIERKR